MDGAIVSPAAPPSPNICYSWLLAGSTLGRERDSASNPPSQKAYSHPYVLMALSHQVAVVCSSRCQVRTVKVMGLGGRREEHEEGQMIRVGWGQGPCFSNSNALRWPNVNPQQNSPEDANSLSTEDKAGSQSLRPWGSSPKHR